MIKWKLPTVDTPGFLGRRQEAGKLIGLNPLESTDIIVDFLEQFVETKKGISRKDQLMNELTEKKFSEIMLKLLGYEITITDPKEESSVQQ